MMPEDATLRIFIGLDAEDLQVRKPSYAVVRMLLRPVSRR
jgi:hypothetical protein